jgi:hypothetical protein
VSRILVGHEDLRPRKIVGFTTDGCALLLDGDKVARYELFVNAQGKIHAEPEKKDNVADNLPDQLKPEPARLSGAARWAAAGIDQT